ncbi:N-alpha-acetyltransferase [Thalictrum thalictroides]|uniref:N-alpha-acetyltransferase 40 n=1 Tax=Thalictrum thalictroides TaxID=46969 RepID=A0A7J6XD41_THATH|nr:N-alpha-acetyltransferase [Thalictrum thalictroides]
MDSQKKKHQINRTDKKIKRREILENNKAIEEIIKAASTEKDHLVAFPPFRHYNRNGLSVYLESGSGEQLSSPMKHYIQTLLKVNMKGAYGPEWSTEEKIKRREMVAPEARYIFVRGDPNAMATEIFSLPENKEKHNCWIGDGNPVVGFVQYRFVVEEDVPVAYVYELQLEGRVQGKGLGKFLMQLIELIARKSRMGAVVLTVQKANGLATNFYINKLRYMISTISPSKVNPLLGAEKSYEILCKTFDHEAKSKLEEDTLESNDLVY